MNENIEKIKSKAVPVLKSSDVEFAAIFGSYGRGEASEESDVDLLIRFACPKSLFDLVHLERTLTETLNRKVDVVTEQSLSPYIRENVLSDLKVLYGKR